MDPRLKRHPLGFWEAVNKPTPQELRQYYAEKYYQEPKGTYQSEYSEAELKYFRAKLEQFYAVIQHCREEKSSGTLLDVGCGEGHSLAFFRGLGWTVRGLDFSSAGVQSKNPGCLDALLTGDVYELLANEISSGRTYDVVWLASVLEHVLDPLALLESLRAVVAKGGVAVVAVPSDCSITQQAALANGHIDRNFWVSLPDHLTYFDYESLSNTAAATGWECLDILGDFPVDWLLFHPGSNYIRDKSVGKAAHLACVQLENLIHTRPIDDVIQFWSALAKLGFGRGLTAFLRPAKP